MKTSTPIKLLALAAFATILSAQAPEPDPAKKITPRPDPNEIPLPVLPSPLPAMPGVDKLPTRTEMPDIMTMNNGKKVKTSADWQKRRIEMKEILEYYAVGVAPPPPGNVKGKEISSQLLLDGKVKYRLVHLTFGPQESLSPRHRHLHPHLRRLIPHPHLTLRHTSRSNPTPAPRLTEPTRAATKTSSSSPDPPPQQQADPAARRPPTATPDGAGNAPVEGAGGAPPAARRPAGPFGPRTAEQIAASNQAIQHGWAFVTFNNGDCGEDTTLRLADGSWAYRTTRFFPAYPKYDWGLLNAWAWGVSRIVDYLETDPSVDKTKFVVTGVSRTGKSALIAGAFDDRIAMVAPVASSGGGTPAYRYSGSVPDRGGKEGLTEMVRKYPNWYSDHLHQFWGQPDKLPFDEHWFIALCAPRPFITLEGTKDQNVNQNGVYQSFLAAKPAYDFLNVPDKIGIGFADRPHGMVQGDWDALLAFGDKYLMNKPTNKKFDYFPPELIAAKPVSK